MEPYEVANKIADLMRKEEVEAMTAVSGLFMILSDLCEQLDLNSVAAPESPYTLVNIQSKTPSFMFDEPERMH